MRIRKLQLKKLVEEILNEDFHGNLTASDITNLLNFVTKIDRTLKTTKLRDHLKYNNNHEFDFEIIVRDIDTNEKFDIT